MRPTHFTILDFWCISESFKNKSLKSSLISLPSPSKDIEHNKILEVYEEDLKMLDKITRTRDYDPISC